MQLPLVVALHEAGAGIVQMNLVLIMLNILFRLTLFIVLTFCATKSAEAITFTENDIGSTGIAGSYSVSAGTYSVGGGGTGIGLSSGSTDNLAFASTSVSGNIELVAKVNSQTNTSPYAIAGLMIRDSATTANAQTAMISVSPQNGVNFTSRLTDGTTATRSLGPSIATSTWLRIVVSGTSVGGFVSFDGVNWSPIATCQMTLPTNYYAGFAVASNISGTLSTAAFQAVTLSTSVPQRSANLLTWLRADDNVVYNGSNLVSFWQDQSANGFNATASTVSGTLVQNAILSMPGINFNGTSDFLKLPLGFSDFSSGASVFVVVKPTAATASTQILNLGTGSSNAYNLGLNLDSSSKARYFVYNSTGATLTGVSFGTAMATVAQLLEAVQTGTSATIWTNAATPLTNASMNSIPTAPSGRGNNFVAQSSGGGSFFNGTISEIIIMNSSVTSAQRLALESYFLSKYGL